MSRAHVIIAAACAAALVALLGWSTHRHTLVTRCVEAGGQWNGPKSRCDPDPHRITIQRELYRS